MKGSTEIAVPVVRDPSGSMGFEAFATSDANCVIGRWHDSGMWPTIQPGDVIEVDFTVHSYRREGVYMIDIDGRPALRRISRLPFRGKLTVTADSGPDLQESCDESSLIVMGQVRAVWSRKGL